MRCVLKHAPRSLPVTTTPTLPSHQVKNVTMGAKTRPCSWLKLIGKKA